MSNLINMSFDDTVDCEECGIGDYRPRYGRFELIEFDVEE